jgi:hypothetical protein
LLAFATAEDWEVHQLDYKSAFLNGEADAEIYMNAPPGLHLIGLNVGDDECLKVDGALYGLKQAPRLWKKKVDEMMSKLGYMTSVADPAVYFKSNCIVAVYVDDLLILSSNKETVENEKQQLMKCYEATDLGELYSYLGFYWVRDRKKKKSWLHQGLYTKDILTKFRMGECKPNSQPLPTGVELGTREGEKNYENKQYYQEVVGSLIYLSMGTRPDITFAVMVVSRYMNCPKEGHWGMVKSILRYLRGTQTFGLEYDGDVGLIGYADSDWGADKESRRSTTGYCFLYGGLISWKSKKQSTVALSTVEAEYMALASSVQESMWLIALGTEIGLSIVSPVLIYQDNQGSMSLAKNPGEHSRTKHIDIRHHFVREKIEQVLVKLKYCPTQEMVADLLTKSLPANQFRYLREKMKVVDVDQGGLLNDDDQRLRSNCSIRSDMGPESERHRQLGTPLSYKSRWKQ